MESWAVPASLRDRHPRPEPHEASDDETRTLFHDFQCLW